MARKLVERGVRFITINYKGWDTHKQHFQSMRRKLPEPWTVQHADATFELSPTPFGHLGIFPEQAGNWDWIAERVRRCSQPPRVLNLFAYTGGSTLAAAAAGAEVVHVDAAKNVNVQERQITSECSAILSSVYMYCSSSQQLKQQRTYYLILYYRYKKNPFIEGDIFCCDISLYVCCLHD